MKIRMSHLTQDRKIPFETLCKLTMEVEPTRGTIYSSAAFGLLRLMYTGRIGGAEGIAIRNSRGYKAWRLIDLTVQELKKEWHLYDAPRRAITIWLSKENAEVTACSR